MKKKTGFEKFMSTEKTGAAKKEFFRQEKKKITKERKEYFEKKRAEAAQAKGFSNERFKKPEVTKTVPKKCRITNTLHTVVFVPGATPLT
jgi:hypothetical protein